MNVIRNIIWRAGKFILSIVSTIDKIRERKKVIVYLENEVSRLSSLVRYLVTPTTMNLPVTQQTKESFDFQWEKLPIGRYTLKNENFRNEATGYVCQFTSLSSEWFRGKNVADIGCGSGRYSWALCTLGAKVLSVDQSAHGLREAEEACKGFLNHRILQADLLKPLPINETFDLVWCFGVLHHTGDTYNAFKNIVPLVKHGGYLFLMIYGEPRTGYVSDYEEVNEYVFWRKRTQYMSLEEKLKVIDDAMHDRKLRAYGDEYIHGYFDAISPVINDLYGWEEIYGWLLNEGFEDIKRTLENRNHFIIARKK